VSLLARYSCGTDRLVAPEETLARIAPHLARMGITRVTDVTRLDTLGIPTCCAIRPAALSIQVSNGKGVTPAAARVSATMEAIELHHAEHPWPGRVRRTSLRALLDEGAHVIRPEALPDFSPGGFGERFLSDWVAGEDLVTGATVWAPAGAVYFFTDRSFHLTTSNGLASGNHIVEATLHALYEVIERDAMARLSDNGIVRVRERTRIVDTDTIADPILRRFLDAARAVDTRVVLMWLPAAVGLHTFWAVLLNRRALASISTVNVGWGTHADMHIAASRAITEAAQSRLTFIHGAREDLLSKAVAHGTSTAAASRTFRYFDALVPACSWDDLTSLGTIAPARDLETLCAEIVGALARAGHRPVIRFDLTHPDIGIPVARVVAPTLRLNRAIA